MGDHKKLFGRSEILCLVVIFFIVILLCTASVAGVTSSAPGWTFTKKFPKPAWWTWGKDYEQSKPVRGGYYRGAAVRYIGLMNPNHWPVNDWVTLTYVYESPIVCGGDYRPSIPWLATDWDFLDPLTAVMKFRKGVKFHDGSDFNAESFKYQIDWIKNKKNGCWSRGWIRPLKSMEVIDAYTVKFHFKKPWAGFWGIIANVPGYPMSAKALKQGGRTAMDTHPVGTGMFMFEDANPGNFVKLKRNPNWWPGPSLGHPDIPYFDGIIVTVIPDPSVRLASLRAGKIDGMVLDRSQYALAKDDPSLKVYVYPQNHVAAMRFNLAKGPCKDIRVRKAISHAIDRRALIAGTQFGLARIASCMYPGDHWAHNPALKPVKYDPELSKKLLAQAGYSNGLTITGYMGNTTGSTNVTEAIKSMLVQVGITWKVDLLEPAAISDRMKNLEYDFAAGGWGWIWDPDLMATGLYMPSGGFNYGRSNNKEAIALIKAGRKEIDIKKRQKIYFELEKVLYNDYEDAWLWWDMTAVAYRKCVMGWNTKLFLKGRQGYWYSHPMWFKDGHP